MHSDLFEAMIEPLEYGENVSLLIRHAEKEIFSIEEDINAPLTESGRKMAYQLGRRMCPLTPHVTVAKTSPVGRCVDSLERIKEGMGFETPLVTTKTFGSLDPFFQDLPKLFEYYLAVGSKTLVKELLNGVPVPRMTRVDVGLRRMFTELIEDGSQRQGLGIYMTHDVMVAITVGYLSGDILNKDNWVDFLEGIAMINDGENINLAWRGRYLDVTDRIRALGREIVKRQRASCDKYQSEYPNSALRGSCSFYDHPIDLASEFLMKGLCAHGPISRGRRLGSTRTRTLSTVPRRVHRSWRIVGESA